MTYKLLKMKRYYKYIIITLFKYLFSVKNVVFNIKKTLYLKFIFNRKLSLQFFIINYIF